MSNDYVDDGIPVIRGTNMSAGRFVGGDFAYVSSEKFKRDLARNTAVPGDVVFTQRGTLGQVALVPRQPHDVYVVSQSQMRLRVDPAKADPRFVYLAATAHDFLKQIDDNAISTGVPHTNLGILSKLTIPLPSLPEQQAIAEVLGALDDKIAANAALAATASELADRWLPQPTLDAAPTRLGDVVTVTKGNSYKSADLAPSNHALVSLKSVTRDGRYTTDGLKPFTGQFRPQQVIAPDEIVVAQTDLTHAAEVVGRAVRVPANPEFTLVASLDLAIVRPATGIDSTYLLGVLRQGAFREHCRSNTTGTTVLHLRSGAIEEFATVIASKADQERYARTVLPLLRVVDAASAENRTLAATRDALLPQLMSGKLRVRDAERVASEAGA